MSAKTEDLNTDTPEESPVIDQIYRDLAEIRQYMDDASTQIEMLSREKMAAEHRACRAEKLLIDWSNNKIDGETLLSLVEKSLGLPSRDLVLQES